MANFTIFFVFVIVCGCIHIVTGFLGKKNCSSSSLNIFNVSTKFDENSPGEWSPVFTFDKYSRKKAKHIRLKFELSTTSCGDVLIRHIDGHVIDNFPEDGLQMVDQFPPSEPKPPKPSRTLQFHQQCNKNAKVLNVGKKAQIMRSSDSATLMTNRPLKKNEMFQIKCSTFFRIGITTIDPLTMTSNCDMNSPEAWKQASVWSPPYFLYLNGNEESYCLGTTLNGNFKAGDTLGVMIGKDKTLHFYYNGQDCGVTTEKVNKPVYGFIIIRPMQYYTAYAEAEIVQNSELWSK